MLHLSILLLAFSWTDESYAASASLDDLKGLQDPVVHLARLPKDFHRKMIQVNRNDAYTDYEIEYCDQVGNCCNIRSGHEIGDNVSAFGKKKEIASSLFGRTKLFFPTPKELQKNFGGDLPKRARTEMTWAHLKAVKHGPPYYAFGCEGVPESEATSFFLSLEILKK